LKNKLDLRTQAELDHFESAIVAQRAEEALPEGDLDQRHYCAIHRHLYQDVYAWAGRVRTVRTSKGGNLFCYPENIASQMSKLFGALEHAGHFRGLDTGSFATAAAHFLAELNAIHAFREGNGRAQLTFLKMIGAAAGHRMDFKRLDAPAMLEAMIASYHGDETKLAAGIRRLIP